MARSGDIGEEMGSWGEDNCEGIGSSARNNSDVAALASSAAGIASALSWRGESDLGPATVWDWSSVLDVNIPKPGVRGVVVSGCASLWLALCLSSCSSAVTVAASSGSAGAATLVCSP